MPYRAEEVDGMSEREQKSKQDLGQRLATYQGLAHSPVWAMSLLTVSFLVFFCGFGPWVPEGIDRALQVLGFVGFAASIFLVVSLRASRKVELHQRGIVLCRGRQQKSISWEQIREIYGSPIYRRHLPWSNPAEPIRWSYRLVCRDGKRVRLAHFEGLRGLGHRIETELTKRLMPLVKDSFQAGYVIRFGRKLGVSDQGIHLGITCIPWHQIADVAVDEIDYVRIAKADNRVTWIRVPSWQVSNLQLLAKLLDSIRENMANVLDEGRLKHDEFGVIVNSDLRVDPGHDVNDLLAQGYDLEEIREVMDGERTVEELYPRHHRPRYPR